MEILYTKVLIGPNIYAYQPVIEVGIDLLDYDRVESREIKEFNHNLLSNFPGLYEHSCSTGKKGGFLKRLNEGTYLGHVIEHLALEIQASLGHDLYFGKTIWEKDSIYKVVFAYKVKEVGEYAIEKAVEVVDNLIQLQDLNRPDIIKEGRKIDRRYGLGPSTEAILNAAIKRRIPVLPLDKERSLYQLGYGIKQKRIEATIASTTSCIGVDIASDKSQTKDLLLKAGLPVPDGCLVKSVDELRKKVLDLEMPLVVKPYNGNHGKGVSLNVYNWYELEQAFYRAKRYSELVMVEEFIKGKDYRLLVIGERLAAASERTPAAIIGDGSHTIQELIELINDSPKRGFGHEKPLTKINIDQSIKSFLLQQGFLLSTIPAKNRCIYLRANGNLSTGGTAKDVTHEVHPHNRWLAVRAASAIDLDIAGIDIITSDIRIPLEKEKGAIIEVNSAPGFRMHLYPLSGSPRDVGEDMIKYLFPEGSGRIPIISITGTNGKTTTTKLVGHILRYKYDNVGLTTTGGIYINEECILPGDNTGPRSARTLLRDSSIEICVLETARGGILREGLGYEESDIGVVTNITEDHLGSGGIESLEDLANIKALIVETVRKNGYCVLNADDPMVVKLATRCSAPIIYFSTKNNNVIVKRHCQAGGKAVYLEEGKVIYQTDDQIKVIMDDITKVPITFKGLAGHNIENVLAAIGVLLGLNIDKNTINRGLTEFGKKWTDNLGRLNLVQTAGLTIILDYGHNPAGFKEVFTFMQKLKGERMVGIIGVPGDRNDDLIIKAGEIAGNYLDNVYLKEDKDLRGRQPGEVANLLKQGLKNSPFLGESIIIPSEKEALKLALTEASHGDVIVCFYEKDPEELTQIIRQGILEFETKESILQHREEKMLSHH